jgi:hypothetical protein
LPYQRFVKTTPKPRATKNSSGELVGPLLLPFDPELGEEDGLDAEGGSDAVDMVALEKLYNSIRRWVGGETQPFAGGEPFRYTAGFRTRP